MAYLNHDSDTIVVDAVLTKKGRELLTLGGDNFKITKFAVSDQGVDYSLWNPDHSDGSNYYGETIENMPLLEANPNETLNMQYKLVTMDKDKTRVAILEGIEPSVTVTAAGIKTIVPRTNPQGVESVLGYTMILHDSTVADIQAIGSVPDNVTPARIGVSGKATTLTTVGKSFNIMAKTLPTDKSTNVTIVDNDTGAAETFTLNVSALSVLPDGSINASPNNSSQTTQGGI